MSHPGVQCAAAVVAGAEMELDLNGSRLRLDKEKERRGFQLLRLKRRNLQHRIQRWSGKAVLRYE